MTVCSTIGALINQNRLLGLPETVLFRVLLRGTIRAQYRGLNTCNRGLGHFML